MVETERKARIEVEEMFAENAMGVTGHWIGSSEPPDEAEAIAHLRSLLEAKGYAFREGGRDYCCLDSRRFFTFDAWGER